MRLSLVSLLVLLSAPLHAAPLFSKSQAVRYTGSRGEVIETKARLTAILGEDASGTQIRAIAGAMRGADVTATPAKEGGVRLSVSHPSLVEPLRVVVQKDERGRSSAHIEMFRLDRKPNSGAALPQGAGARIFARQVVAAQQLGLAKIDLDAAGGHYNRVDYVGHIVWPRFGFNGPLPDGVTTTRDAPRDVRGYLAQGKRAHTQWAKSFDASPGSVKLSFSLAPNSQSMRDWNRYRKARGIEPDVTGLAE